MNLNVFDRRKFLKLTAGAPALALIPRRVIERKRLDVPMQAWAGKVEVTAPAHPHYGSHCVFAEKLPFTGMGLTLEVVPKFKCWNEGPMGRTFIEGPEGESLPVDGLMELSLGAAASELPYIVDLHFKKRSEYWMPITIPKGSRATIRLRDSIAEPTKYDVHMAISGS